MPDIDMQTAPIHSAIQKKMEESAYSANVEKTFFDKVFGKDDVQAIRMLMKKEALTRADTLELLYLLTSTESKLYNYSANERYVMAKFFIWIRSFAQAVEKHYDYLDDLEKHHLLDETGVKLAKNVERTLSHITKFCCDVYLMISRSSLSLGGVGFREPLLSRFEVNYSAPRQYSIEQEPKRGFLGMKRRDTEV